MAQAKQGDTVQVHYTGRLANGEVFDTSANREPLEFTIGEGQIIPGFERAVIGMNPGESKTTTVPADQAYGQHRQDLVLEVDRAAFPPQINPEIGQQLVIRQGDGSQVPVVVTDVSDTTVELDSNHPLAGKDLTFDIELVRIV